MLFLHPRCSSQRPASKRQTKNLSQDFHVLADERLGLVVEGADIVMLVAVDCCGVARRDPDLIQENEDRGPPGGSS